MGRVCRGALTRTVELYGRQAKLLGDLCVFYLSRVFQRQTLDALGHVGTRRNSTPATESLELDVRDDSVFVYPDLQFHDIPASG